MAKLRQSWRYQGLNDGLVTGGELPKGVFHVDEDLSYRPGSGLNSYADFLSSNGCISQVSELTEKILYASYRVSIVLAYRMRKLFITDNVQSFLIQNFFIISMQLPRLSIPGLFLGRLFGNLLLALSHSKSYYGELELNDGKAAPK